MTNANWRRDRNAGSSSMAGAALMVRLNHISGGGWQGKRMAWPFHWLVEALSTPSTTILAVTIFVGQTGCVKLAARRLQKTPVGEREFASFGRRKRPSIP